MTYFIAIWFSRFHYAYRHWLRSKPYRPYCTFIVLAIILASPILFNIFSAPVFVEDFLSEFPSYLLLMLAFIYLACAFILYWTMNLIKEMLVDWQDKARALKKISLTDSRD